MDILALVNSAINFILYCFMSRQFRQTFEKVFKINLFTENVPRIGPPTDMQSSYV